MEIFFLGVGEACDTLYPNTSLFVKTESGRQILLDCGFTTPHIFFMNSKSADGLDALWISHFHGDHFFGVPLLLLRFWEMNRKKPLAVLGPQGIEEVILQTMDLAYPRFRKKLCYDLNFAAVEPGAPLPMVDLLWQTADCEHSQRSLALRLESPDKALFYSGDGRPTSASLDLARGCDLIVQEAFLFQGDVPGHGNIGGCLDFARKAGVNNLALVHMQRQNRSDFFREIQVMLEQAEVRNVFLPEPGDSFLL